jgi:energy-converting hydrogenase Eha subunit A
MALYTVYLSDRFDTSLLLLGITQTVGDIFGATLLLFLSCSGAPKKRCTTINQFAVPVALALFAATLVGFTVQNEALVLVSQVIMGTCYVMLIHSITALVSGLTVLAQQQPAAENKDHLDAKNTILEAYFVGGMLLSNMTAFTIYTQFGGDVVFRAYSIAVICYSVALGGVLHILR